MEGAFCPLVLYADKWLRMELSAKRQKWRNPAKGEGLSQGSYLLATNGENSSLMRSPSLDCAAKIWFIFNPCKSGLKSLTINSL